LRPASRPLVYAHRGGAVLRPENTIVAFDNGLALGADGLELDVHLSRDGVVVVHHDATLDRTTDAHGALAEKTADELARVDAGYWFQAAGRNGRSAEGADFYPFRGQGIGIPGFREVLAKYPSASLIVELKVNHVELARAVIEELRHADAIDRVAIGSFGWRVLRAVRELEPRIATGAAREEVRWALYRSWVYWPLGETRYREFQVPEEAGTTRIVTRRFVAHAHRAGLPVKVWTVNDPADMRRLLDWGVDALISDRPDFAVAAVTAARGVRGVRPGSDHLGSDPGLTPV
jgi:glycerophosphoryl diester phosphodiesterase